MSTKVPKKLFWAWFTVLWCIGTIVFISFLANDLSTALAADSWPRVSAKVVTSQVVTRRGSRGSTRLVADIAYQYTIDNVVHRRSTISAFRMSEPGDAGELVQRFPVDAVAEAAVNPADPNEAYLHAGFRWAFAPAIVALVPMLGIGTFAAALSFLRRVPEGAAFVGPFVVYAAPLPRLVTLIGTSLSFGLFAMNCASIFVLIALLLTDGAVPTWNGTIMIPPGTNPGPGDLSWLVLASPIVSLAALAGCWLYRRHLLAACEHEIVVDVPRNILVTAKGWNHGRRTMELSEISGFVSVRTERSFGTKKHVTFAVHALGLLGEQHEKLLSTSTEADGRAVADCLNEAVGIRSGGHPVADLPEELSADELAV